MEATSTQTQNFTVHPTFRNSITTFTGVNILLVLIYGLIVFLMGVIAFRRLIVRKTLTSRFLHKQTEPGSNAPDKLKYKINQGLDKVCQFYYEPKLLSDSEPTDEHKSSDFYRMKTIDTFSHIDKAFAAFNEDLKRPMGKDVWQHLLDVKSHSSGCLKSIRTNQIHSLSDLYIHARYGPEPFGAQEYSRFKEITSNIVTVLRQRTVPKVSARVERSSTSASQPEKSSSSSRPADQEPLL